MRNQWKCHIFLHVIGLKTGPKKLGKRISWEKKVNDLLEGKYHVLFLKGGKPWGLWDWLCAKTIRIQILILSFRNFVHCCALLIISPICKMETIISNLFVDIRGLKFKNLSWALNMITKSISSSYYHCPTTTTTITIISLCFPGTGAECRMQQVSVKYKLNVMTYTSEY
jgi:hypothetical protein